MIYYQSRQNLVLFSVLETLIVSVIETPLPPSLLHNQGFRIITKRTGSEEFKTLMERYLKF